MNITLSNIKYSYSGLGKTLNIQSLQLNKGITGLLGINGAGKSTLINILATMIKPKSGSYTFGDINVLYKPLALRKILGYLPQNVGFIQELTVYNYIRYIGLLKGCSSSYLKKETDAVLELLNLLNTKTTQIKELSGGMKQRAGIAQAIINKPKFLILDEPMVGLDPNERNSFNALLSDISEDSIILMSSHIIEDLENICENIILMEEMSVKYYGTVADLISSVNHLVFEKTMSRMDFEKINDNHHVIRTKPVGKDLIVRFISEKEIEATQVNPTLEDAFIYKTKMNM